MKNEYLNEEENAEYTSYEEVSDSDNRSLTVSGEAKGQYDDYEEITDGKENLGGSGVSLRDTVNNAMQTMQTGMDTLNNVANLYSQCMEMHEHTKQVEAMTQVKLANTIAKFKICQQALTMSFAERDKSLSKLYDTLDKGIESGNQDLIIEAMSSIGNIVTKSPLSEIKELCQRFDDKDDNLIDF